MTAARTERALIAFRIGDPEGIHAIYGSEGARLYPGRWNKAASPIIYASEYYSTAMLEKLVHANAILPPNQHYIRIILPAGTSYEAFPPSAHPGWDDRDENVAKDFGATWYSERRSALLFVPSLPARLDRNILINPMHPDAAAITHEPPQPVWWDDRLFR